MAYKYCAVPLCGSTTVKHPTKLFIHVPKDLKVRKKWLELAKRDPMEISLKSTIYFCQDHFNLPDDMENYVEYSIMGWVKQIRLKPNCLPSMFTRQPEGIKIITSCYQPHNSLQELEMANDTTDGAFNLNTSSKECSTDASTWLRRPDVCRCCLAGSGAWDLTGAYMSEESGNEVLLDMLRDCLGIALSNVSEWGPSRFICNSCATSLRQAHNFKQQVLRAEDTFASYLGERGGNSYDMAAVKTEENVEQDNTDYFETHDNEVCGNDYTDLVNVKTEDETNKNNNSIVRSHPEYLIQDNLSKPPPRKSKKKSPRHVFNEKHLKKSDSIKSEQITCDKYAGEIGSGDECIEEIGADDKCTGKISCSNKLLEGSCTNGEYLGKNDNDGYDSDTPISQLTKANGCEGNDKFSLTKEVEASEGDISQSVDVACKVPQYTKKPMKQVSERKRIRLTCETVIAYTTACPFRHHKSWFQCFYCTSDFMEINMLREHTLQTHKPEDITTIKRYPRSLQIDITDFQCKLCCVDLTDVKYMVKHFAEIHGKIVYKECIADYKVNSSPYTCHICCKQYHVFRTLTTHLNVHYANCICDVCGKSFLNSKRLKVHKRTHESGDFPCTECGKVLKTKTSKANHMESHSKRIIKCHICLKPMKHYNDRIKHMSEEHNITHKFKCLICGREYKIKHYLATHMRQTHGHKNKKCLECGMAFITNHGLKKHMLKHTGVKAFACTVCNKSYARSYTLREHMRGHEGEAKFVGQ